MNIGERIKQRRKEIKMSADELAARIGRDRATIFRYENGEIENMPIALLQPIAETLQVSISYLMGLENEETEQASNTKHNSLGLKIKNARKAKGLTQEELGILLGVEKSAVAKYENGRVVNLKHDTLIKLSDILDLSPSDLVIDQEAKVNKSNSLIVKEEKQKAYSRDIFSKNLRLLMVKKGKSRKDVSEAIKVSYFTFSDWCNGKKYPRIEKLENLAEYFGVSVQELVGELSNESVKHSANQTAKKDVLDIILRLHVDEEFLKTIEKISALDNDKLIALNQFLSAFGK